MKNLKKKIFVSYRFSGEDMAVLKSIMDRITSIINAKGCDFFCSFYKEDYFKEHKLNKEQRYEYYKKNVLDSDVILFFIKTADKSGGMEFELDLAKKHDKKIVIAIKNDLDFQNFRNDADEVIEFGDLEQFYKILSRYNF